MKILMQNFFATVFFLNLILFSGLDVWAQQNVTATMYVAEPVGEPNASYMFEPLEVSGVPTNLLHDKATPVVDLAEFNGSDTAAVSTLTSWRQACLELASSAMTASAGPPIPTGEIDEDAAYYLSQGLTPIALLSYEFNRIKEGAIEDSLIKEDGGQLYDISGPSATPYTTTTEEIFTATVYKDASTDLTVRFIIPSTLYLNNRINPSGQFQVDFGDGSGFRTVSPNQEVSVTYPDAGEYIITVEAVEDGIQRHAETSFTINAEAPTPDESWLNQQASRSYAGLSAEYDVHVFYGDGNNQITKPVIVVEPFDPNARDPARRREWEDLYDELQAFNLDDVLLARGYDIVLLKFHDGAGHIQKNAFALIDVITTLNNQLPYSTEIVIIGPSMGGLVARYALCYMEDPGYQGLSHNVRLLVTFDTPHRGANVPLGDQMFAHFFAVNEDVEEAIRAERSLKTPAARQMLVYHFEAYDESSNIVGSHPLRETFISELSSLDDYPQQPRLVAIANGSGYGNKQVGDNGQQMYPLDQIIEYDYYDFGKVRIQGNVWALPDEPAQEELIFLGEIDKWLWAGDDYMEVHVLDTSPFDNTPGGYRSTQEQIAGPKEYGHIYTDFPRHSFVPTVSAVDLAPGNLSYDFRYDPSSLIQKNDNGTERTALFNAIYYPFNNEEHVDITQENSDFLLRQIGRDYVSSTTLASNITFVRNERIIVRDGVTLTFNGQVDIEPGVHFLLGNNARIVFNGTVNANGSVGRSVYTIHFEPLDSGDEWDWLRVDGIGSTLEDLYVSGAERGVYVAQADNVTISHSTFTDNSIAGLYFYESENATVEHNEISNNSGHGIFVGWGAEVNAFNHNVVTQNGGKGIYIFHPSTLRMDDDYAHNRITNNGEEEIYLTTYSARLYASNWSNYGGHNDIIGDGLESGHDYINNFASNYDSGGYVSWTVPAEHNYWGVSTVIPYWAKYMFDGPVDYDPWLSESATRLRRSAQVAVVGSKPVATEVMSAGLTTSVASGGGGDRAWLDRKQYVLTVKNWIASHPADPHKAGKLRDLYGVLVWDRADRLGARASVLALLEAARADYATLRITGTTTAVGDGGEIARLAVRLAGETAMMLRIEDLLRQEKADEALLAAKEYEGLLQNRAHQRGLHLMRAVALQRQGNYQEAIAAVDAAAAVAPPPELAASFVAPDYGPVKQDLLLARAATEGSETPKIAQPVLTAEQIPQKFAVGSPYPNPFNGSATLPLELPQASEVRVEVYDVLGRRVAVLLDEALAAGAHEIRFDAQSLAAGVYVVRAAIEPQDAEPRHLSWKLTLVE